MSEPHAITVDARGRKCPQPVILLAKAARDAPEGALVEVLCTDPASRVDIPAWTRMTGHTLTSLPEKKTDGVEEFSIAIRVVRNQD